MVWFRVDDSFHSHPKVRATSPAALGLWVMAGTYCAQYATDGVVPRWFVSQIPHGLRLARTLVEVGLWSEFGSGLAEPGLQPGSGWVFHDWADFQPSKEEIERDRESNRARQKRYREARREARNAVTNDSSNAVSNGTPTRPVPSLPTASKQAEHAGPQNTMAILASYGLITGDARRDFVVWVRESRNARDSDKFIRALHARGELTGVVEDWKTMADASNVMASRQPTAHYMTREHHDSCQVCQIKAGGTWDEVHG